MLWISILIGFSCTQEDEKVSKRKPQKIVANNVPFNPLDLEATNPKGGIVKGRLNHISTQESLRRLNTNVNQPILFGRGVGGITIDMSFNEIHDILAEPLGSNDRYEFFPEGIWIQWDDGEPRRPLTIVVDRDYKGQLKLPGTDQQLTMGTKIPNALTTGRDQYDDILSVVGASLEGKDPNAYNCIEQYACRYESSSTSDTFDYSKGGLIFDKETQELNLMYFIQTARQLPPFVVTPIIYGTSLGGLSLTTNRATAESFLTQPIGFNDPFHYYDDYNIAVHWAADNKPELILAVGSFRGKIAVNGTETNVGLGSSVSELSGTIDITSSRALVQSLYQLFEGQTDDCLAAETCLLIDGETSMEIRLPKGLIGIDKQPGLPIAYFGLTAAAEGI